MIRHTLLTPLFLLTALIPASAQRLTSSQPVIDCGRILFQKPHTVTFTLHNKTNHSVSVKDVETSCNCTTAMPSRTHVPAGKDVTIRVTYDARTLGHFEKEIWLYEQGQEKPVEMRLKGIVVADIKDFSGSYPFLLGKLRADRNDIEFDDVNKGTTPTQTIHIMNVSGETAEPVIMHLPDYLQASVSPARLAPDQAGEVTFTLLSDRLPRMGLSQNTLYLGQFRGDKSSQEKEISVSAILLPSFDGQAQNSTTAPHLSLSSTSIDRADMTGKPTRLKGEIEIQNTGKSTLNISSLQMFTIGMQVSLGKTVLEPGEMTKLKVQVNEEILKRVNRRPRILMITNDPSNPKVIIQIN